MIDEECFRLLYVETVSELYDPNDPEPISKRYQPSSGRLISADRSGTKKQNRELHCSRNKIYPESIKIVKAGGESNEKKQWVVMALMAAMTTQTVATVQQATSIVSYAEATTTVHTQAEYTAAGGGDINVSGANNGINCTGQDRDSALNIEGNIKSENGTSINSSDSEKNVTGSIESTDSQGIWSRSSEVTVGGNATGKTNAITADVGTVNVAGNTNGDIVGKNSATIIIKGDATGNVDVSDDMVLVDENGDITKKGVLLIGGDLKAKEDETDIVVKIDEEKIPDIVLGEIPENIKLIDGNDSEITGEDKENILNTIQYYVEASAQGGKVAVAHKDGTNPLDDKSGTYIVAQKEETLIVTVNPGEGYIVESVSGGKATASKNEDGTWSVVVPFGGGVKISAVIKAIQAVDSSGSSDSSSSGYSSVNMNQVTLLNNLKVQVESRDTKNGFEYALVKVGEIVKAAVGEAKTAGLPEQVVETIHSLDNGNLGAIAQIEKFASVDGTLKSVGMTDLSGYKPVGGTIAVLLKDTKNAATWFNRFPQYTEVAVVYYNNMTGKWSLIPAAYDKATGLVDYEIPEDGTVLVVYR